MLAIFATSSHPVCQPVRKAKMRCVCHELYQKRTGGSCLSRIFWEHENLSDLSVIWLISTKINFELYKN